MRITLWFLCSLLIHLCIHSQSKIIILYGLGSTGKSSISNELEHLFTKKALFISFDRHFLWPSLVAIAEKLRLFTPEMLHEQKKQTAVCNCQSSPLAFEYGCKKCFDPVLQNIISKNIASFWPHCDWSLVKKQAAEKIKYINQEYDYEYIVVDIALGRKQEPDFQEFRAAIQETNCSFILIHCSLEKLIEHIIKRNSSPNPAHRRDFIHSLTRYCAMYKAESHDNITSNDQLIFTQEDLCHVLEMVKKYLEENKIDQNIIEKQISKLQELYMNTFFLENNIDAVELVPLFYYDLAINTGNSTPQQAAQLIYEFTTQEPSPQIATSSN